MRAGELRCARSILFTLATPTISAIEIYAVLYCKMTATSASLHFSRVSQQVSQDLSLFLVPCVHVMSIKT